MKYLFSSNNSSLVITLDTENGKYEPEIISLNDPNVILDGDNLYFYENGIFFRYFSFYHTGTIDGAVPVDIADAFAKLNALLNTIRLIASPKFKGSIVPADLAIGTEDAVWIATQAGTYPNHGNVVVNANSRAEISRVSGVFSISQTTLVLPDGKINFWAAEAYPIGTQRNHLGKDWYLPTNAALSTDVPGTSVKWVERLTAYSENTELVALGLLNEGFTYIDQIKPTPFTKYIGAATLDSKTHYAWYVGKTTEKINEIYVPLTSVYNGSVALTDSVYVRLGINGVFTFTTEITLAQMAAQGINTQSGVEATTMYKISVPEFTINNTDIIFVGMMCKSATDKLGFVAQSTNLTNEWVNGYNSHNAVDINGLSTPPAPSGSGFAYNIYFKLSEKVFASNLPLVSQAKGTSTTNTMSQKVITDEINLVDAKTAVIDGKIVTNTNALLLKADRKYQTLSTFSNKTEVNGTTPFWMTSNNDTPFKYVQFNIKAKGVMTLKSLDFAGAYITTGLTLGTGNVSLRVYKGVAFSGYVSDFTNAVLLRKVSIPIADFYANSTKAATSADLKTALLAGNISYTTFNFSPLDLAKDEVLHFFFGADDDTYYQNTPNTANPTMRISLVQSSSGLMLNTLFGQNSPSTFYFSSQAQLINAGGYPSVKISALKETAVWNNGSVLIDNRNIYTFIGAFNTVLDALFTAKPKARVLIIGHNTLSGSTATSQSGTYFKQLVDVQQRVADYWGANYLPLWQKLNWKNNGTVNTFKTWCPDEIHPYSNTAVVSTSIGNMSIADFMIHDFVKDALKPIFGDNWAGKKVATYGTSIPYGGKYTILAANELGGVGTNYCQSGSILRRGKTDAVPVTNSFTDTANITYRNYQKDMLDLIGTANEPDLFVFDFGINDYNLDSSDFDVIY